jgi:hypothetical protein
MPRGRDSAAANPNAKGKQLVGGDLTSTSLGILISSEVQKTAVVKIFYVDFRQLSRFVITMTKKIRDRDIKQIEDSGVAVQYLTPKQSTFQIQMAF